MDILLLSFIVGGGILLVILLTSVVKLNAYVSLFIVSLLLAVLTLHDKDILSILKSGFGGTMASIGFLIIEGAIIAIVLEKSGATYSIANYIISRIGKTKAATAMSMTGFIAGLPIFCDSGYIILSGLAKSFSTKLKLAMPFIGIVLATSLYSVHCLVPTHPGMLAAAGIIDINLGYLILLGIAFSVPAAVVAFLWTKRLTRKMVYASQSDEETDNFESTHTLPSVFLSLLPIITPLLLITMESIISIITKNESQNWVLKTIHFFGQPPVALIVGVVLSLFLLRNLKINELNKIFDKAIEKAGSILIVTAAGGMFGMVIKETGIGTTLGEILSSSGLFIAVPFLITFILKTAQGSSTVAIITAASLVSPMLTSLGLNSEWGKLLTLLSMGAGSMMISHANDSYFWVVSKFSGIHPNITLRVYSSASAVMGLTVFLLLYLLTLIVL